MRNESTLLFNVFKLTFGTFGAKTYEVVWAHVFPRMIEAAYFETINSFEFASCLSIQRIFTQNAAASLVIRAIEGVRRIDMLVNAIIKRAHICIYMRTSRSFLWIIFMKIWAMLIVLSAITS